MHQSRVQGREHGVDHGVDMDAALAGKLPARGELWSENDRFVLICILNTEDLPRHARDNHRENSKKEDVFSSQPISKRSR